ARDGAAVRELRETPAELPIGGHRERRPGSTVLLTVGTDAAVGKMTASLEIVAALQRMGKRAAFVATGQTGIAIAGKGVAVDAVDADFIAGAAEQMGCEAAETICSAAPAKKSATTAATATPLPAMAKTRIAAV